MNKIVVVGSINIDIVTRVSQRPKIGETVFGDSFAVLPGGKGANQAVFCAALGQKTEIIGCVGRDIFARQAVENLRAQGVGADFICCVNNRPTGSAVIVVENNDNSIIVIPGANYDVSKEVIEQNSNLLKSADVVLLQLEIPIAAVNAAIEFCFANNVRTVLNPAPAQPLDSQTLDRASYITPNQHEFSAIFGHENYFSELKKYPEKLIVTLGEKGCLYSDGKREIAVPAKPVQAIDTTGAGDTFNAAFACAIAANRSISEALNFANQVAAVSVACRGAQGSVEQIKKQFRNYL